MRERVAMRERPTTKPSIVRMPRDGNCLFHGLGYPHMHHAAVRHAVVAHLRLHWDEYAPFVDEGSDYLVRMARDGEWGDELVLRAFHHFSGRPICVLDAHTGEVLATYTDRWKRLRMPWKRLVFDSAHYDVLE
jgi:hypothetical protein